MTDRTYIGEVLLQIWSKSMKKSYSELLDSQVYVQKDSETINSKVHIFFCKPTKKCAIKIKKKMMTVDGCIKLKGSTL